MVGDEPGGSVWLRVGILAKTKLWDRMPRRIKFDLQRPGRKPFYSGLLVNLNVVEDKQRDRWPVFKLRTETVKALQGLKVIGGTRQAPSRAYERLSEIEVENVPAGLRHWQRLNASADRSLSGEAKHHFGETCWPLIAGNASSPAALSQTSSKQLTSWMSKAEVATRSPMVSFLLRADWHTLFDLSLWAIHPRRLTIEVSPTLADEYHKAAWAPSTRTDELQVRAAARRVGAPI